MRTDAVRAPASRYSFSFSQKRMMMMMMMMMMPGGEERGPDPVRNLASARPSLRLPLNSRALLRQQRLIRAHVIYACI